MQIENFEQFVSSGSRLSRNVVTITKDFGFHFSSGFYSKVNLKSYKYVIFFHNQKENAIGLLFSNQEGIDGKFIVTHNTNSKTKERTSGGVTARSFFFKSGFDKNSIKELIGSYEPKEIKHPVFGRMYFINLNEKLDK